MGGPGLILTWYAFGLTALAFVPVAVALSLTAPRLQRWPALAVGAAVAGALAGLTQAIGLMRWVFVIPGLARAHADARATPDARAAAERAFDLLNAYGGVLRDPWEARDDYVETCIGARSFEDFAAEHVVDPTDPETMKVARALLESQRLAMAMYTSCGWFFNDIAGIEARIVLRFAAGLILELQRIDEALPTEAFVGALARAEGNQAMNGDAVWRDVLAEVSADAPQPTMPPGGWAPILADLDRAQEAVFAAVRKGDPIDDDTLGAVGRSLGLAVP